MNLKIPLRLKLLKLLNENKYRLLVSVYLSSYLESQVSVIKQLLMEAFWPVFCNVFFSQETTDPMETHFLLADNVYCKALVPPTNKVCLWLGVSYLLVCSLSSQNHVWEQLYGGRMKEQTSMEYVGRLLKAHF